MSAVVMVVGEGLLADRVCGDLSTQYEVIRRYDFEAGVPETTDLVLVLHDTLNPSIHKKRKRYCGQPAYLGCEVLFHMEKE